MEWIGNIALYAIPAFLAMLALEFVADTVERRREAKAVSAGAVGRRHRAGFSARDTFASLSTYGLGQLAAPLNKFIELPIILLASTLTPMSLSASDWRVWIIAIVGADLAYYADHRMAHRVRLFWAGHSVHHSSQHFNLSTALRLPWLIPGAFLSAVVYIPLALIGTPIWMIFLSQAIVLLYQFPIHTERIDKLPRPIEYVFNTPSHHRVHHGANNPYLDKNYGGIFIIWDRLFRSYAEETEQIRYGLTHNIDTHNPLKVNYHEFITMTRQVVRAKTWRGRIGYLLAPPGWTEKTKPKVATTTPAVNPTAASV